MLSTFRRRNGRALTALIQRTTVGRRLARTTARGLYQAAKKLAPLARAAGAKSSIQRKLGPVKNIQVSMRNQRAMRSAGISADFDAPGNDMAKSKRVLGRKKVPTARRLDLMFRKTLSNYQFRFQNITQHDTNVGANILATYVNSVSGAQYVPLHIYDLTSFPNTSTQVAGRYFGWDGNASTADVVRPSLPGQQKDGTSDPFGYWQLTDKSGSSTFTNPNASVMMHNWSDVRLLLYGARKRSTEFCITFFRVKDDGANPFHAGTTNTDLKQLIEWFTRPLIYNSLQTYDTKIAKKIRIVKQYKYNVPACQTTDVDTTVGKLQEVKIFMRHDKVYNLDWMTGSEAQLGHGTADGLDYVTDDVNTNTPWHSSRLFMAITAFAPEKGTFTQDFPLADANRDPSYDIIIRNSISVP